MVKWVAFRRKQKKTYFEHSQITRHQFRPSRNNVEASIYSLGIVNNWNVQVQQSRQQSCEYLMRRQFIVQYSTCASLDTLPTMVVVLVYAKGVLRRQRYLFVLADRNTLRIVQRRWLLHEMGFIWTFHVIFVFFVFLRMRNFSWAIKIINSNKLVRLFYVRMSALRNPIDVPFLN